MDKTIAFIPVRGGSTSIPLKNIKTLCGQPLLYWTAKAANDCEFIDEVVISTDSDKIAETARSLQLRKVSVTGRSAATATNTASTESALIEYAENNSFDKVALIQATSPLLSTADLDAGFELLARPNVDSVVSVVEDKRFYWSSEDDSTHIATPLNYDVYHRPRRQDFNGCFMENGAFYLSTREQVLASSNRVSGRIAVSVMPPETSFEIDEPEDWTILEALLARRLCKDGSLPESQSNPELSIKLFLTDCDGCLTDAGMYYSESGEELKKFNTRDGMAFALLHKRGIKCGIITGENSQAVARRAKKLDLEFCELACKNKLETVQEICKQAEITLDEVLYIGDDLNDVELLLNVGCSACPADAQPEVKQIATYVAQTKGGSGVIREVASALFTNNLTKTSVETII